MQITHENTSVLLTIIYILIIIIKNIVLLAFVKDKKLVVFHFYTLKPLL